MACKKCEGRGFIDTYRGESNQYTALIQQCPNRCNIAGYSAEVQRRLNNPNHVSAHLSIERPSSQRRSAQVIPFRRPGVPQDGPRPLQAGNPFPKPAALNGEAGNQLSQAAQGLFEPFISGHARREGPPLKSV